MVVGLVVGQLGVVAAPLGEHASVNIADAREAHAAVETAERRPREAGPAPCAHDAQRYRFLHDGVSAAVAYQTSCMEDVRASPPGPSPPPSDRVGDFTGIQTSAGSRFRS